MPVTALIVRVPEAEPLVGDLRARFDPTAEQGVPAHITVLVPFMAPEAVSPQVLAKLHEVVTRLTAFDFHIEGVGRWPNTTFVKPTPAEPFIQLTTAVSKAFPNYPPYAGAHSNIVPHLTVADGSASNAAAAETELTSRLAASGAIASRCSEVALLENSSQAWKVMHVFSLAAK